MVIDPAATAWVLACTAMVLLMTPGLAIFYGGMVRSTGVLNMIMMCFISIPVVTIVWLLANGILLQDIVRLRVDDVDAEHRDVRSLGRNMPVTSKGVAALRPWVEDRNRFRTGDWLFVGKDNQPRVGHRERCAAAPAR